MSPLTAGLRVFATLILVLVGVELLRGRAKITRRFLVLLCTLAGLALLPACASKHHAPAPETGGPFTPPAAVVPVEPHGVVLDDSGRVVGVVLRVETTR